MDKQGATKTYTVEVEVFPDGATAWLARGTVKTEDGFSTTVFDWFDITAHDEHEAYEVGARSMVSRTLTRGGA